MTYQNTQELLEVLKKNNLWAKKGLGQNFLVNKEVLNQIVAAAALDRSDYVVEVGPGLGILTEQLEQKAGKVLAVELDAQLIPILQTKFMDSADVKILHMDALKLTLPEHDYKVIANIPYYITSPLLNHFLQPESDTQKRPGLIVLLIQKEVAEKVCAPKGDHSVLSLQVQVFGKPSIIATVGKTSFFPQPKVDSAILKIETYPEPLIQKTEDFFKIIKKAFSQRRKTLQNSLNTFMGHDKEKIIQILDNAGIDGKRRPQDLEIQEWNKLIAAFNP